MEPATSFFILTLLTTTVGKTVHYTDRNLTQVPIDAITPDVNSVKLSNNKISHLGSFNTTPYIRFLFVDNNQVKELFPQTFNGLGELRILDLDRNYIVSLRDFIFSDLAALLDLFLSNNIISAVSERAFHGLASLEFLELSGNRLSSVPMQAIKLIPSKQLLVALVVNNISQIPQDLKSAHPSATYLLQGNPLRCPDVLVSHDDKFNIENMDKWPLITPYIILNTEHNRTFVERSFLLKRRYQNAGVVPTALYVPEHMSFDLPLLVTPKLVDFYFWNTPTGRYFIKPATKTHEVEDFTAEDSGMYTSELTVSRPGKTQTFYNDLLMCLIPRPKETQQQNTKMSPSDDFLPKSQNITYNCSGSTNQSCCSYWLVFKPSLHQKFCVVGNTDNSQGKHIVLVIVLVCLFISLVVLSNTALFCWRKRQTEGQNISTVSTTLHIGVQAMAVCIPHHNLLRFTDQSTEGESKPNAFPLKRLQSRETHLSAMTMGVTQYSSHCVTEARQADTDGTTEAQVHHYDNDDALDADEEVQYHQYASAAPPPLPVCEETVAQGIEAVSEQPAFHLGNTETGEEEMPYGVAAANSLYQRDTALNSRARTSEHACSASANDCVVEGDQAEERFHAVAEANTLYHRDTAANCRTLYTREHAGSTATNGTEAADPNQTETVITDLSSKLTSRPPHVTSRQITILWRISGFCTEAMRQLSSK
uniref:LRRCT domain-containing protein n=1 Tax=Branchiostoma floridae TaxID=7739 RepID=C3YBL1_BRAFL|eukprot:XP_002606358.1 hypothetical protein BRAFLDRAFT_67601 [Branchiostoma floridae]